MLAATSVIEVSAAFRMSASTPPGPSSSASATLTQVPMDSPSSTIFSGLLVSRSHLSAARESARMPASVGSPSEPP